MIESRLMHCVPADRSTHHTSFGIVGTIDLMDSKNLHARDAILFLSLDEAVEMAEAFAGLVKDIQGAEKIARLGNMGEVA